jgi:thermitase
MMSFFETIFKRVGKPVAALVALLGLVIGYGFSANHPMKVSDDANHAVASQKDNQAEIRQMILSDAKASKEKQDEKRKSVLMSDPSIKAKWGLEQTSVSKAWEVTQGSKDIIVAIIDTGIDKDHKDLSENLWVNAGETGVDSKGRDKASNGIDDDKNGFIDDVHGWDFVHNGNQLTDNHGHGTHIAGIIGANGGNKKNVFGVSGVAPHVSLMILKYFDPKSSNSNNLKNTVEAMKYAVKMHANIINYSGGGTDYSAEEFAAVKEAEKAGILFVAAAGNERSNSDESGKHYYPADYGLSNIISVTAANTEVKVLASSNYGVRTVDIAAPGENIYSTLPGNAFGMMTGTSQATAFVSGVAALVMSHNRELKYADVKKYILNTGDEYTTLLSKTGHAKLLNSYKALVSLDSGVSASGVLATNTAGVSNTAFASDRTLRNAKTAGVSGDPNEDSTESIAMFGKEFLKAMSKGHTDTTNTDNELRKR